MTEGNGLRGLPPTPMPIPPGIVLILYLLLTGNTMQWLRAENVELGLIPRTGFLCSCDLTVLSRT